MSKFSTTTDEEFLQLSHCGEPTFVLTLAHLLDQRACGIIYYWTKGLYYIERKTFQKTNCQSRLPLEHSSAMHSSQKSLISFCDISHLCLHSLEKLCMFKSAKFQTTRFKYIPNTKRKNLHLIPPPQTVPINFCLIFAGTQSC